MAQYDKQAPHQNPNKEQMDRQGRQQPGRQGENQQDKKARENDRGNWGSQNPNNPRR